MTKSLATLIVYAYSSFTSTYGAGPEIIKGFEKKCDCKVILIDAGDAGAMLSKVKLEGDKTKADVLVGIDSAFQWRIKKDLGWNAHPRAFDRGPLAFVYNSERVSDPPQSLDDLLDPKWKKEIAIEDPRLSTVGLNFLLWVIEEKGEEKAWEYLEKLKDQVKVVTPSWDLAYGLFKKNQVKLVLSYWTSPAYHIQEEKRHDIKAAVFNKGHFEQIEYAMVNPHSKNPLVQKFLDYLLSPEAQKIIPLRNFMYPYGNVSLPEAFQQIGQAPLLKKSFLNEKTLELNLEKWLKKWRQMY